MSVTSILLDILIVLVAAKLAAEIAERVGFPPVVAEILAGVVIGPSVLDLVGTNQALRVLGEIGVILLLLQVGMEMDLGQLGAVGRAAVSVAVVGVVLPMLGGFGVSELFGYDAKTALFLGAALAATSVGITARVFSDLRALASVEARTVLGAAVADDVLGLVILTVVVRIVSEGSVSVLSVVGIFAIALAFLVATTAVGARVAPPVFQFIHSSPGCRCHAAPSPTASPGSSLPSATSSSRCSSSRSASTPGSSRSSIRRCSPSAGACSPWPWSARSSPPSAPSGRRGTSASSAWA